MQRYAVVGNPIAHSRSPEIHAAFAAQFDAEISYDKTCVEAEAFDDYVREFAASGGRGLNVTVPFKGLAYELVDECNDLAAAALAVNTIKVAANGRLQGFNTDGVGLVADLERHQVVLAGARIILLGAGGAARGVVLPLIKAGAATLTIANRTVSRATEMVSTFAPMAGSTTLSAVGFDAVGVNDDTADVIINATSLGLSGGIAPIPDRLVRDSHCYDMSYGASAHFANWAGSRGAAQSIDGLGMLVEQAAESFFIWRDQRPRTEPVIAAMREALAS